MSLKNLHFVDEALRLVKEAEAKGIQLRILGSIAYRLHSPKNLHLFAEMERELTDVDFGAYRRQGHAIREFMIAQRYKANEGMYVGSEGARQRRDTQPRSATARRSRRRGPRERIG